MKLYILFCLVLILLSEIRGYTVSKKMKRLGYKSKDKQGKAERVLRRFMASLTFFVPLFNIIILFVILFADDEKIIEKAKKDFVLKEGA